LDAISERPPTQPGARPLGDRVAREVRRVARDWLLPSRTMRRRPGPPALGLLYIVTIGILGGLAPYHFFLGLLGLLDLYNERTRLDHHWPALDLACGFAYVAFAAEHVLLALLLFFIGRVDAARIFAWSFLLVNVLGFATYFVYPAAPPWWVTTYGLGAEPARILPAPAATLRFDALLGINLFRDIYRNGIDVFGSYPSLHVSYPFLSLLLSFRYRELHWARVPAALFFLLVCLSAVYLQHHYVTDVVLGIVYAAVALAVVLLLERRSATTR